MEKQNTDIKNTDNRTRKIVPVVVACAFALAIFLFIGGNYNKLIGNKVNAKTIVLKSTSLTDTLTVDGTVESCNTVNITGKVKDTTVNEILVQVGDKVTKGQTIMKLDTQDILSDIARVKEKLENNKVKAQADYDSALLEMNIAHDRALTAESEMWAAKSAMETAEKDFNVAIEAVENEQKVYNEALAVEEKERIEYSACEEEVKKLKQAMDDAEAVKIRAENEVVKANEVLTSATLKVKEIEETYKKELGNSNMDGYAEAVALLEAATIEKDNAALAVKAAVDKKAEAETAYETAKTNYENGNKLTYIKDLENAKAETDRVGRILDEAKTLVRYTDLEKAYTEAKETYTKKRTELDSREKTYLSEKKSYENAKADLEDTETNQELNELNQKYADCTIKAPIDGTITEIKVVTGEGANGTLAVIEDTANLKINTAFSDTDIHNVSVGMKCRIATNTKDNILTGYISHISPVAENSVFPAEIAIDGTDHGLLIGMNTKVNITISIKENIFAVPYSAVTENENGESVIYAKKEEDKDFTEIAVSTGIKTDTHTEILSPQLKEGMVVRTDINIKSEVTEADSPN